MNWSLLQNSLAVATFTTVVALALGFLVALAIATSATAMRRLLLGCAVVTLALPPFLVVNSWLELFGAGGWARNWVPIPLFSMGGTTAILALMFWPISTLLIVGAWDRLEPAQWESDPVLHGTAVVRYVLWPAARSAAGLAAIVTVVLALNQFAIPVILQVPVFSEELWLALTARLDNRGAWAAAGPLVLAPAALLFFWRRGELSWPRDSGHGTRTLSRTLGPNWRRAAICGLWAVLALGLFVPLAQLLLSARTWNEVPGLLKSSRGVVVNTGLVAAVTATLGVAFGLLLTRLSCVNRVVGATGRCFAWLLFFVPGVLLAKSLLLVLGGTNIYGTFTIVFIAFLLRYLAVGWQGAASAWEAMDQNLMDVGRMEGVGGWTLFRNYAWPQLFRPVAATWYVSYLLALWDVETLVLIYPPGGETLALRIFHLLHYGHNSQVNAMCVTLLGLALLPTIVWWPLYRVRLLTSAATS